MYWKRLVSGVCGLVMTVVTLPLITDIPPVTAAGVSESINDGLMAYLDMDNNIEDKTGTGSPDKVGGFTYVDGLSGGKAIRFDGEPGKNNSNRLQFNNRPMKDEEHTDLEFGGGVPFTVSYWIKPYKAPADGFIAGTKDWSAAKNYGYSISTSGSKFQVVPQSAPDKDSGKTAHRTTYNWPGGLKERFGEWMHVCVTSVGNTAKIYVNGKQVDTNIEELAPESGRAGYSRLCVGADYLGQYGIGNSMDLDEFKVWNRVITDDEVHFLFQDGVGEITGFKLSAPENLAVGTEGVSVDITTLVSTSNFEDMVPEKSLTWSVSDTQNAVIEETAYGTAKLAIKNTIAEGAKLTVTVSDGSVSASKEVTVTKNVVPTKAVIIGKQDIVVTGEQDVTESYQLKLMDDNGAVAPLERPSEIKWELSNAHGVVFAGQSASVTTQTGARVSLTIPKEAQWGDAFTLNASYDEFIQNVYGGIIPDRTLSDTLANKVTNRWNFDGDLTPAVGSLKPTLNGEMTYANGIDGKSAIFRTGGNSLNFGTVDLTDKTISFALKANYRPSENDPAILANKDWNTDANAKGFVFAYSYDGSKKAITKWKSRIGGTTDNKDKPRDATFDYQNALWHTVTISFDVTGKRYTVYLDTNKVMDVDTSSFSSGWQNGSYPLILGNDGTQKYTFNGKITEQYEFLVDNFTMLSGAVTPGEVAELCRSNTFVKRYEVATELVGAETALSGSGYNLNVHLTGDTSKLVDRITFDVHYDTSVLEYNSAVKQYDKSGISIDHTTDPGILHVTFKNLRPDAPTKEYGKSRVFQPVFKVKDGLAADVTTSFKVTNLKEFDASDEQVNLKAHDYEKAFTALARENYDYNGDGVVGAGDVALAPVEKKEAAAAEAAIYPYKRALVLTMDGGGNVWDEDNAYYLPAKYTVENTTKDSKYDYGKKVGSYTELPVGAARSNNRVLRLYNKEFATSFTAKAEDPPISAQNYCSINHGQVFKSFPSTYQRTNDSAGIFYWEDFGKSTAQYPSMFKMINQQTPRRRLFASTEWSPITNGVIEPDSGTYQEYPGGATVDYNDLTKVTSPVFQKTIDYINSGKAKNTALLYMQTDLMDHYGHAKGYFTDGYYKVLSSMDKFYENLFNTLEAQDLYEDTLFIGNADHGGHFNNSWNWPSGSHGEYGWPQDTTIFIGIGGQTVNSGQTLKGGENHDIPALVLDALRLEKPSSMSNSDVFDPSAFLKQEELSQKNREIEKVSYRRSTSHALIGVSNEQAGRSISALDAVINVGTVNSADSIEVTPAAGVTVLRKTVEDGKLKLTLSGEQLGATAATLTFTGEEARNTKVEEVMLGAAETGKEIYSDLENINFDDTVMMKECTVSGLLANVILEVTQQQDAVLVVAQYDGDHTTGMKTVELTSSEMGIITKEVTLDDVAFDKVRVFLWDGLNSMQPLCNSIDGKIVVE